jgi:peptide/nickel transport system substrate-binding protein
MRDKEQMYDILFLWKSTYYADPNNWVGEMYDCDQFGGRNNSWYCNTEVDKLLKAALATANQDERAKLYEKASVMVMEDAAGIFVYNTKWFGPFNRKVTGIRFCPIGDGQEMRWASMD